MIQSKLISLFQTLTPLERRSFKKWLRSPLHNPNQEVVQLFDFLMNKKKITAVSVRREKAWVFVYPNLPYQDAKMRVLMHEGLEILRKFVGVFSILLDECGEKLSITKEMVLRGQFGMAQKMLQEITPLLTQAEIQSDAHFARQFQLETLRFELIGTQQRTASNNLPQIFSHSANYFMLNTLRYACIALSHTNVSTITYEIPLLKEVLDHIRQRPKEQAMAIRLYFYIYQALVDQDDSAFAMLSGLFMQHRQVLPKEQQQEILLMAINFCIKRLNTGAREYAAEAFALYEQGLTTQILLEQGSISRFNFKNIVSIGLILKKFEWVGAFIDQYTPFLPPTYRDSYHNFNLAKLQFSQGNYRQAKRLLTEIEYDDVFFNLSARMMMLKMHYEEQEWDALEALLTTFSRYLQRKSVLGYHKQVYQNIIGIVRQFMKLPPGDVEAAQQLMEQIRTTQPLAEREWLLQQLG